MPSGEDRLIERFFRPLARDPAALGLVDDAAVITPPGTYTLTAAAVWGTLSKKTTLTLTVQ